MYKVHSFPVAWNQNAARSLPFAFLGGINMGHTSPNPMCHASFAWFTALLYTYACCNYPFHSNSMRKPLFSLQKSCQISAPTDLPPRPSCAQLFFFTNYFVQVHWIFLHLFVTEYYATLLARGCTYSGCIVPPWITLFCPFCIFTLFLFLLKNKKIQLQHQW